MKELMDAIKLKWGEDVGLVIYFDMSGHVFREFCTIENPQDYDDSLFNFDDITKVAISDIENAPMLPEEE